MVKWLPENINRPYEEDLEDFNRRSKEDFNRRSKEAARMIKSTLKRLTALKGINRIYIKKIAWWHREGLVDLTNEQDLAKINIFLTNFLAAPICELHNEHFTCKEKGTKIPFDEMPKLVLMDAN